MRGLRALALACAAVACMGAAAADPALRLPDPAKEARARGIFKQVRCLVCQNESIDDSEAPLADDLRRTVREQVAAGRSDGEVLKYLTDRYGEFVLFRPRFSAGNAVLWLAPFGVVLLGGAAALALRRRKEPEAPLSPDEEERLERLARSGEAVTVPPQPDSMNARNG